MCRSRGSDASLSITIKVSKNMRMGETNELWAAFLVRSISLRAKGFTDWQRSFMLYETKGQAKPKDFRATIQPKWLMTRVGYRSHLNRYQYRYRYLKFGTSTQRYLFSVFYSLCNNKNIYFSEKISPKLSISTFWTIGPYNFFLFFSSRILKKKF